MIDLSKSWFEIVEENGDVIKHDILFSFESETDGNTYIVHTAHERDENGKITVYASYINEEKYGNKLMNIENDDAFKTIESLFIDLMEKIKIRKEAENGESDIP